MSVTESTIISLLGGFLVSSFLMWRVASNGLYRAELAVERLLRRSPTLKRAKMEEVLERWYPCTCHEAYTGRGLTDPACVGCDVRPNFEDMVGEMGVEVA